MDDPPATEPKLKSRVRPTLGSVTKPPVPVQVKLVAVAMSIVSLPAVAATSIILLEPNATERVLVFVEENTGQVKLKPFNESVPEVKVNVAPVLVIENAAANEVVPDTLSINMSSRVVFPLLLIVPVPRMVGLKVVYVPVLDNIRLFKFMKGEPGVKVEVPKSRVLNQLPVVRVATLLPEVIVRLGAFVIEPPAVLPN